MLTYGDYLAWPEGDEADAKIRTVVQPDLTVVWDPSRLDRRGCRGAPDFILEIVSPSTAPIDQNRKVALYSRHVFASTGFSIRWTGC